MIINRNNLNCMFLGFQNNFKQGFERVPDTWQKFAAPVSSGSSANIYPFIEHFGGMKEWIGDRQINNVSAKKIEVVNRDFEDTVSISRNDIEDDQYGIYGTLIAQMGYNAGKIWQDLAVAALLSDGDWIDGENFFSSSRLYGEHTVCNTSNSELTAESYATARQTMLSFCGHNGRNLGVVPDLLIVGPKLEATAFSILKDRLQLNAVTRQGVSGIGSVGNPWNGSAELLVLPELCGAYEDVWFLTANSGILKPVIVQQRKHPVLTALDHEQDENVFARKEYLYGTDARGEAFLAFPHLIYRGGSAN